MPQLQAIEEAAAEEGQAEPGSAVELFLTFAGISLQAFGGALSFIERAVVRDKRWLSPKEFLGVYAVAQVLPGPTGISFCVLLGDRFFGFRGALAALAGFLLPPAVIVLLIASAYEQFERIPQVQGALHGMGAACVGLIVTTALRMSRSLRGQRVGIVVAILSFCAVALARLPVSTVMLSLGVLSVIWAWRSVGR
jgi:chromate transporter